MKTVKAKSSKYINDHSLTRHRFEWQIGYGVFSYRQRDFHQMFNYVKNQEVHHRNQRFRDEYSSLLREFKAENPEQGFFFDEMA